MTLARIVVHIGPYGSGKTEISLNTSLRMAALGYPVTLVDLDIVNPYFRSGERREQLEAEGIRVITPAFEGSTMDVPVLPPGVESVLADERRRVVFDVGGDSSGAAALGRYKPFFERAEADILCVVNTCRPFMATPGEIAAMVRMLESRSRLKVTGLIHNSNLARETTPFVVLAGQSVVEEAARNLGIPVNAVCGLPPVLDALPGDFREGHRGRFFPLTLHMRPDWMDMADHGNLL